MRVGHILLQFLLLLCLIGSSTQPALANSKYASIVVDVRSGKVIQGANAEEARHPASLTKIMTLYLTFKALRQGGLRLDQALPVSEYAASQSPSKLGLMPGRTIRVRDAILGLVTQSANDAAVVLGEKLGGSEGNFARLMTAQARQLGMNATTYRNASGLPDDAQITTARDQAILARAMLYHFPDFYHFFRTSKFTYLGRVHANHNRLMNRYSGMDGIKTGYIRASGFNLVASVVRDNTRLIAVIFGGNSARERDNDMAALLDSSFARLGITSGLASSDKDSDTAPITQTANEPPDEEVGEDPPARPVFTPPVTKPLVKSPPARSIVAPTAAKAANKPAIKTLPKNWAVEIGTYEYKDSAVQAVQKAARKLPPTTGKVRYQIIALKQKRNKPTLYRAQLIELDNPTAVALCRVLKTNQCRAVSWRS